MVYLKAEAEVFERIRQEGRRRNGYCPLATVPYYGDVPSPVGIASSYKAQRQELCRT